ncbi:MAG: DUF4432 family protein [Clostridia bacterium]|nr:DUF4432 family protein [Clostridia bacterium]
MKLNGKEMTKADVLRRTGNIDQIAYVRKVTLSEGKGEGIRLYEIANGSGIEFSLQESKCLDILDMKYKGENLRLLAKTGPVAETRADNRGINYLRSISGGFMYTCGLSNVGKEYEDGIARHYNHGRVRFIPAEKVSASAAWEGDEYKISVKGEMRDSGFFNDNLVLRREIYTSVGEKGFHIRDVVENEGFSKQPIMIMYHMNLSYPLIDKNCEFFATESGYMPIPGSEAEADRRLEITDPVDGYDETGYLYTVSSKNGKAFAGVYNKEKKLGILISFEDKNLPYLLEWKSMRSGDYAFGIMPTNCHIMGREKENELGTLKYIESFEKLCYNIDVTVIDGDDEYNEIKKVLK